MSSAALAQVVPPTRAEQSRHAAHAQQLRDKQQSRKQRQRRQETINRTASKAYVDQPALQTQMRHATKVRQRQADARKRDLDEKIKRAEQPLPPHVTPAPASSR